MKNYLLKISTLFILILFSSCTSSDEATPPEEDNSVPTTYFPLKTANFWDYAVENRANGGNPVSSFTDHLYVGNDFVNNSITYKRMLTSVAANGFFSSLLKDNGLRIDGTRLRINGTLTNTFFPGATPITINLTDFILLKDNSVAGTLLSSVPGQTSQTISGYPVVFDYTLKSVADGTLSTFTSNSINYTNVKRTKIILTMSATTIYGGIPVTALQSQDVSIATLHFVPNLGMVYNNRVLGYTLLPQIATLLGVPASSSQLQEEYIGTYDVSH